MDGVSVDESASALFADQWQRRHLFEDAESSTDGGDDSDDDSDDEEGGGVSLERYLHIFGDTNESHGESGGTFDFTPFQRGVSIESASLSPPFAEPMEPKSVRLTLTRVRAGSDALFAHYVWNSAIVVAEMLAAGRIRADARLVCEIGAGAALPAVFCAARLSPPAAVVATDYPDPLLLMNMRRNARRNAARNMAVVPLRWGDDAAPVIAAGRLAAERAGIPVPSDGRFSLLILTDTLWMPDQHAPLVASVAQLLSRDSGSRAIVSFTLQHDRTFEFFDHARAAGFVVRELLVTKIPVMSGGKVVAEKLSAVAETKRTVYVYELAWPDALALEGTGGGGGGGGDEAIASASASAEASVKP
jgi:predicted nicotinamide N-methyase